MFRTIRSGNDGLIFAESEGKVGKTHQSYVDVGGILFSPSAIGMIQGAMGRLCNGLTEEQVECARLRAELEAAREEGVIASSLVSYSAVLLTWILVVRIGTARHDDSAATELAALQAACQHVRALRAEREAEAAAKAVREPVLPDVEVMSAGECEAELLKRRWMYVDGAGISGYVRGDTFLEDATGTVATIRAALTHAREIDKEADSD